MRPLDLGREHRFLADVGVEEEVHVGKEARNAVEAAQRHEGGIEAVANGAVGLKRRVWWKRRRHERADGFARRRGGFVRAGRRPFHACPPSKAN